MDFMDPLSFNSLNGIMHCGHDLSPSQTINFRLFRTERVCRRYFNFKENGRKLFKWIENTVGKSETALLSHSVFKRLVLQTHKNKGLFGKGLINNDSTNNERSRMKFEHLLPGNIRLVDRLPKYIGCSRMREKSV